MKLQAHVIMSLTLGLSMGIGSACQKTGKTSRDLAESKSDTDTEQESTSEQGEEPHPKSMAKHDPCYACGMG